MTRTREFIRLHSDGRCAYCHKRRAVNRDHVIPKSLWKRGMVVFEALGFFPDHPRNIVAACFECNIAKGRRLLVPPSWAHRVDELTAMGLGTFRVWHGDAESLREVVR